MYAHGRVPQVLLKTNFNVEQRTAQTGDHDYCTCLLVLEISKKQVGPHADIPILFSCTNLAVQFSVTVHAISGHVHAKV